MLRIIKYNIKAIIIIILITQITTSCFSKTLQSDRILNEITPKEQLALLLVLTQKDSLNLKTHKELALKIDSLPKMLIELENRIITKYEDNKNNPWEYMGQY